MSLFQNSVLNKYLKGIDSQKAEQAWNTFKTHFHNPEIQENIRNSKEEQYQGEFLIDLFVNVFGYVKNPSPKFNLTTELKNIKGAKKTDGAIIQEDKAIAVIELKGTNTVDLAKVETQAFGYKNNQPGCKYVITSNFEKLRFYIDNAVEFEEFFLFNLSRERFDILYLCLSEENLLKGIPKQIKDESLTREEAVTKKLYKDYSKFRNEIFDNIQKQNAEYDKLTLFKKTQKLLDRFLFIFFAEDRLLLPPNSIREIVTQWTDLRDKYDEYQPLYDRFKKYFGYMKTGYEGKKYEIFAYNGGLFAPDEILDAISIDDDLLYKHTVNLSNYDFESEVSVNILGHIFEHSLTEIENIQAQLEGLEIDKSKTKRKKDGVFYTPKYITKYIVDNTVGKLCEEKKSEIGIIENEFEKERKGRKQTTLKKLIKQLDDYRLWLLQITICDPACGSGAFLNQTLEFLIEEHSYIDELKAKLLGGGIVFTEVQNDILENNIFGVDINEESVEIAKLSLWLRTAKKGRKLSSLNNNIKCGNSLIDDPLVAGDKAFVWSNEFPEVFEKGGFDIVIGNPPYVNIVNIENKKHREFFQNTFKTYKNKSDLYSFFIEKEIEILKPDGIFGNIFPNSWMGTSSFSKFRNHLLEETKMLSLVKLPSNVFIDAVVTTVILTFSKNRDTESNHNIILSEYKDFSFETLPHQLLYSDIYKIESKTFSFEKRIDLDSEIKLGDVAEFSLGVKTSDDKRFVFQNKESENHLPFLRGKNISKYSSSFQNEYIWYMPDLMKEKAGGRPRILEHFLKDKIIIQDVAKSINATIDRSNYLVNDTLNVIHSIKNNKVSLEFITGILNSKLINTWFDRTFPEGLHIKINQLQQIPIQIPTDDERKKMESLVDKVLELNSTLENKRAKYIGRVRDNFNVDKVSNKLKHFFDFDFKTFVSELKKKKNKLSLSDQDEWEEYFDKYKEEINQIQNLIKTSTDNIDNLVFELYKITEDEVKMIEKAYA